MKILRADAKAFHHFFAALRTRGGAFSPKLLSDVARIVREVSVRGDEALFSYTRKFDGHDLTPATVEATDAEKEEALAGVNPQDREVIRLAAARIEKYHRRQIAQGWSMKYEDGAELGQRILPLARVGVYAPGGKAFYPSTILMAAIPARLAGVKEVLLASPVKDGRLSPLIAAAAEAARVDRIFKIGGAQAIAALAYGTESVPRVDKIVGPGNAYVAAAKKLVFGQVAIDMIAGPSEVAIIADSTADPVFAAADMLAQAEHDEKAAAVLFTPDPDLAREVAAEIRRQIKPLPRKKIIQKSLSSFGAIIITADIDEAAALTNLFAPEHLELMVENPTNALRHIRSAGSVFLGSYTPEALGDYIAGANHILPTEGTARFSSPLGVYDFYKRMSVLSFSRAAFENLSEATRHFARMEGLCAHANSVQVRCKSGKN
ncbi:MAG TPA: histidinol dehydrogenase [Smithellaceae bacterium]|jgi:histidinol dehydrogenase|nr:histidinol dehydrogenase [Smithellaceae bacterium]HNY96521.1 histidinol dehydrogenase [Smithellaceae bacterium]HOH57454.1 histidinol dehydrogenase [Smithellaceae bacterium]HPV71210.1 histidinol dehydrogenase [Smithellaceae bacterium]HPY06480.1 histidinol dehydrogenase [Smithellaceae bacterium]